MEDPEPRPGPADPDPQPDAIAPTQEAVADAVCRDILAIQRDSYGGGAEHAKAHVLDDTVIVILDELELLPNEEFMIGRGRADAVRELREHFQQAIESTFRAAVERATGRRVIGFASHVQLDEPRFAVEVFRLEP
ncbi:MAG TPA: Na-translocating system protein MpsC family protein [Solirubrobacterales bacterium]|nr:Na-translocating system protein MpsC family protein [Solirubrobacterales bacterium]